MHTFSRFVRPYKRSCAAFSTVLVGNQIAEYGRVVGWLDSRAQAARSAAYARFPRRRARDLTCPRPRRRALPGSRCAERYSKLRAVILANPACPASAKVVDLGIGGWVSSAGQPGGCPRSHAGGLTWQSHRPFGACEAAPGPLESLAPASAEAYPARVWPAHPVRCFGWSMPPRDRAHQQGGAITPGGVATGTVRTAFSEWARTVADAARVLRGRTGRPGCHAG
jgi:hypothetical protein